MDSGAYPTLYTKRHIGKKRQSGSSGVLLRTRAKIRQLAIHKNSLYMPLRGSNRRSLKVTIMTKKDYQLIADAIVSAKERIKQTEEYPNNYLQLRGVRRVAAHLSDVLGDDNPAFDTALFIKACGYGG